MSRINCKIRKSGWETSQVATDVQNATAEESLFPITLWLVGLKTVSHRAMMDFHDSSRLCNDSPVSDPFGETWVCVIDLKESLVRTSTRWPCHLGTVCGSWWWEDVWSEWTWWSIWPPWCSMWFSWGESAGRPASRQRSCSTSIKVTNYSNPKYIEFPEYSGILRHKDGRLTKHHHLFSPLLILSTPFPLHLWPRIQPFQAFKNYFERDAFFHCRQYGLKVTTQLWFRETQLTYSMDVHGSLNICQPPWTIHIHRFCPAHGPHGPLGPMALSAPGPERDESGSATLRALRIGDARDHGRWVWMPVPWCAMPHGSPWGPELIMKHGRNGNWTSMKVHFK